MITTWEELDQYLEDELQLMKLEIDLFFRERT